MSHELASAVLLTWLKAYVFTLVVEIPIFVLIARRMEKIGLGRAALAGAAGTLFTHPALWFVWPLLFQDYTTYIITGELVVATIESFTFYALARPSSIKTAFAASFVANAVSYGLGAVIS
jgi:uncharacterized membrane protein YagU involved in acid resistance